jgi:branched-chain amino acid transport system substrate-binding protein
MRATWWLWLVLLCKATTAAEPVRLAVMEPLSGPFANVGEGNQRMLQLAIEAVNARGGVLGARKMEALFFDHKMNPQEALLALTQAVDRGISYVVQGSGVNVTLALSDAIARHNSRHPEQPILFMIHSGPDPVLANEKCHFLQFRAMPDTDMLMEVMTSHIAGRSEVKRVYLVHQDYAYGQTLARTARQLLAAKRPDILIVGDDLHPLGKVKDFAPYVAKIKAAQADTVITGNWAGDLALLIRAGRQIGLDVNYYTLWGGIFGVPTQIGESGVGQVKLVSTWHANLNDRSTRSALAYRARFPDARDDLYGIAIRLSVEMLARAIDQAGTDDPLKVAAALEKMRLEDDAGEVWMRRDNHQLLQPIFVSTFSRVDGKDVKIDVEHTGLAFRTDARVEAKETALPTTCRMERP